MSKMRVSLAEKSGEIKGTIQCDGDGVFLLECVAAILEKLAASVGVPPEELCRDALWTLNQWKS